MKTENKLPSFVAVPADIIDKHLKTASGVYLKVVLYVLRMNEIDIGAAAEALGLPESDIEEALRYWVTAGILPEGEVSAAVARSRKPESKPPGIASPEAMTAGQFEELSGREEVKFLLTTAEQLMGRPLSSTEQKGYVFFLEEYGLPADVIVMAIDFCCMHDRKNYRYIAKMLTGWHDEGINTHPLAEEYIRTQSARLSREGEVVEAFGLEKRGLTTANRKQIAHWYQDLGYNIEMIRMAYERTVDQIGQVSFPYINKILENWHALGLKTPEEVLTGDTPKKGKDGKNGQYSPSYDIQAFSQQGFDLPDMDDHS